MTVSVLLYKYIGKWIYNNGILRTLKSLKWKLYHNFHHHDKLIGFSKNSQFLPIRRGIIGTLYGQDILVAVYDDPFLTSDHSFYLDFWFNRSKILDQIRRGTILSVNRIFKTKLPNLKYMAISPLFSFTPQIYQCRSVKKSDLAMPHLITFSGSGFLKNRIDYAHINDFLRS